MQTHTITPQGYSSIQFVVVVPYNPLFKTEHIAFNNQTNTLKYYANSPEEANALRSILPPNCPLASIEESHVHYHHTDGRPFDPHRNECCAATHHVANTHQGIKYNPDQLPCCRQIRNRFSMQRILMIQQQQHQNPYANYMGSLGLPFGF